MDKATTRSIDEDAGDGKPHPTWNSYQVARPETTTCTADGKEPGYPDNIMAACQAASCGHQKPKTTVVKDKDTLEKRRKANRVNAQRWRKRKRMKFSALHDKIRALRKEQEELRIEQSKLQSDLQEEMAIARVEASHLTPHVASHLSRTRHAWSRDTSRTDHTSDGKGTTRCSSFRASATLS